VQLLNKFGLIVSYDRIQRRIQKIPVGGDEAYIIN